MTLLRAHPDHASPRARAFATLAVLWTIAIVALVLAAIQAVSFRQSASGRETLARVRAYWAARAGVEAQIAKLASNTLNPDPNSALTINSDLQAAANGTLTGASYSVAHFENGKLVDGAADAGSKLNVNVMDPDDLILLESMDETTAGSIVTWIQGAAATDLTTSSTGSAPTIGSANFTTMGAASGSSSTASSSSSSGATGAGASALFGTATNVIMPFSYNPNSTTANTLTTNTSPDAGAYLGLRYPYSPRSAPVRSLLELELVTGVTSLALRGEDWNLNGRLDPNENDGDWSWPPDNADGKLDAGWSQYLTASSELGGMAFTGVSRLDLSIASNSDIVSRLNVDTNQAGIISQHATSGDLTDFVRTPLSQLAPSGTTLLNGQPVTTVNPLSTTQLTALLNECTIGNPAAVLPRCGRFNINTISRETLERFSRISPDMADTLIQARDGAAGGFVNLTDLLNVQGVTPAILADLMGVLDVRSNVYIATSRGRDTASGVEVEIVAELDRSTIPVVIKDLIVR